MLSNRIGLLEYDVPGPVVIHERMILDHVSGDDYVVCTPDRDVFVEQLTVENSDLRSFRLRPSPNQLPPGVQAAQVYTLPAWNAGDLAGIHDEARRLAVAERAQRGVAGGPVNPAGPAAVAAGAQPAAVAGVASGPIVPGARNLSAGVLYWLAAESIEGIRYGEIIDGIGAPLVLGSKIVHTLPDGRNLFCVCVNDSMVLDFNNRPSGCDGRILPRKMNSLGTPEVPLGDAVAASRDYDLGWKLSGPKTALWCLNYLAVEGLGLEGHHERFRQVCKLDSGSWGVQEHFQHSMVLRQLLQVDCINGGSSLGIELLFRRLQTIEYAHSEKAREAEAKLAGGKLALEEQFVFGSVVRHAGTLMISPSLLSHVKEETEREVQLAKNIRKAKEERELATRKGKQNKNQEQNP